MKLPNRETLISIRHSYPVGARVELLHMDDEQAPPIGTRGTVINVDDIGTVHVMWDNGSTLGAVWKEDRITRVFDKT